MPEAALAVGAAEPVSRMRPTVVVNVHRIARSAEPAVDVAVLLADSDALPGVATLVDEVRAGPPFARWRQLRHDGPQNVTVLTWQLLVVAVVNDELADIVSAVGAAAADAPPATHTVVADTVASLRLATLPA